MKVKKTEDNYIEDIKEHSKKQYSPGHYLGGKIHSSIKYKTKKFLLYQAMMNTLAIILLLTILFLHESNFFRILAGIFLILVAIYQYLVIIKIKKLPKK